MGLFGGGKGGGLFGNFDPSRLVAAQAMLEGDYGAAASILAGIRRDRAARDQAKAAALAAQDAEGRRAGALEQLGYGKAQINAIRPQDMSRLVLERFGAQPAGEGGSLVREVGEPIGIEPAEVEPASGGNGLSDLHLGTVDAAEPGASRRIRIIGRRPVQ